MNLTKLSSIVFLLLLCFSQKAQTQEQKKLIDLISDLETKFEVKFSYLVTDVEDVYVTSPNEDMSLTAIIEYLNTSTQLNFKFLTDRYITISTSVKTISICGRVTTQNDVPLFGASVIIKNSSKGVMTDEFGKFQLQDVGLNQTVSISYLGYETRQIKALELRGREACNAIILNDQNEELNEILISKFLTTGLQKRIDGSTVLNTEKFGILPGLTEPDILQSIQALPGVESVNESTAYINVRGGTNDQNLILWDNVKMYHSGHFFGLISAYNPYLTEKVTVTKNGTSSEFSDGVSSTVNMSTKNELTKEFSGGFGANLIHADGFLEIPLNEKLTLNVSARRSIADFLTSPTFENYFRRSFQDSELTTNSDNIEESNRSSEFFFYDYSAKLLFDLNPKHKFRMNLIGISNNLSYKESFTNSEDETESKTSNLKQENLGFGAHWNATWSPRLTSQINLYYTNYEVKAIDFRIESDQELIQKNEVLETGINLKTNFRINSNFNLLNGYHFNEVGISNTTKVSTPVFSRIKKDVLMNHALYSEIEFKNQKTYARAGVRFNYFQKFDRLIVEPRLSLRQKLSNQFVIKVQGEFKNQSATQIIDFQDDFLGVENRRWVLANNRDIPISESKQISMGFEFNQNNLLIDIEGFYKYVDGITASNQGFYNNFQFTNAIGSYQVKGVEFLINKTTQKYSTWLSYTYSTNEYEFKTLRPSVFPNNLDMRHSVSLALNYKLFNNFELSLGGIWRSGRPFTKPVEGNETVQDGNNTFVNYDVPNSENLEDFMRFDASVNYAFKINSRIHSTLRIGVINMLDQKNSINKYYEVDPEDSNATIEVENTSLGLTPNLSYRFIF